MQAIKNLWRDARPLRYLATFSAGAGTATAAFVAREEIKGDAPMPDHVLQILARSEKKLRKLQASAQERIHRKETDEHMLGLTPRLWMEVYDKKHRYASLVYLYWRRWQLSDSDDNFWDWLDYGMGALIDLPEAPRRLLDEWQVIYLSREEQHLFRVIIEPSTGQFLWEADRTPVTLPKPPAMSGEMTMRERAVADRLAGRLGKMDRRDELLVAAKRDVEAAITAGEEPTPERLAAITGPLIEEGLFCQLRDPFFAERHDAAPTPLGHCHHWTMPSLPEQLLEGIGWQDVLRAIEHDQGKYMRNPLVTGEDRLKGNAVFVLDSFGPLYCGVKIRGILQHSSFVRGHSVKNAGGLVLQDGWLVELSPHSGHYQPGQSVIEEMMEDWREKGVDFSRVKVKAYQKIRPAVGP